MRICVLRTGGFTGIPMRAEVDTHSLDPEDRESLEELVNSANFFDLPEQIQSHGRGADRFNYKITLNKDEQSHTIELSEANMPEDLQALVQQVTLLARSARKR